MINHTPAKEKGLGHSLFQRYADILKRDANKILPPDLMLMLKTQYRMVLTYQFFIFKNYFL